MSYLHGPVEVGVYPDGGVESCLQPTHSIASQHSHTSHTSHASYTSHTSHQRTLAMHSSAAPAADAAADAPADAAIAADLAVCMRLEPLSSQETEGHQAGKRT
jgi:hypothetical protein